MLILKGTKIMKQYAGLEKDAQYLNYADGTFDEAVSNFIFHEIRSRPDKTALIWIKLRSPAQMLPEQIQGLSLWAKARRK